MDSHPHTKATESFFTVNKQLEKSCITLIDWPLSRVMLKNNADYPWFILVPRKPNITEMTDISEADRIQLMHEIHQLSLIIKRFFQPDKINLGSLGNIVEQFHFHIVARFKHDPLWPHGIWQTANVDKPYTNPETFLKELKQQLRSVY